MFSYNEIEKNYLNWEQVFFPFCDIIEVYTNNSCYLLHYIFFFKKEYRKILGKSIYHHKYYIILFFYH